MSEEKYAILDRNKKGSSFCRHKNCNQHELDMAHIDYDLLRINHAVKYVFDEFSKMSAVKFDVDNTTLDVEGPILDPRHDVSPSYDHINPAHYQQFSKESIDIMIAIWGAEAVATYCEINAFKYKMRLGSKPDQPVDRDLGKAQWYLNKAKELRNSNK